MDAFKNKQMIFFKKPTYTLDGPNKCSKSILTILMKLIVPSIYIVLWILHANLDNLACLYKMTTLYHKGDGVGEEGADLWGGGSFN